MSKLTLALVKGKDHTETVTVESDGEKFEIDIRPLKHSEQAVVQSLLVKGMKQKSKTIGKKQVASEELELDFAAHIGNRYEARLEAAAIGTIDAEWTKETINEYWLPQWIDDVSTRVFEISGIDLPDNKKKDEEGEDDVETFHQES